MAGGGGSGNQHRWLVSYADFITLMMVFFVVLYSSARLDAQRFSRVAASLRRSLGAQVGPLPGDGSGPMPTGAPGGSVPAPLAGEGGVGLPEYAAALAARGSVPIPEAPPERPPSPNPAGGQEPPAQASLSPEAAAPLPAPARTPPAAAPAGEEAPPPAASPAGHEAPPPPSAAPAGAQASPAPDPLAEAARRLQGLPWPGRAGDVTIQVNDRGLVISLVGSVLFAPGSSELLPQAGPVLAAVAQRVRDLPGALLVESVADDAPPGAAGLDLAARRGTAVAGFLTTQGGIPAGRVAVIGRTAPAPAAGDSQRRVDIIVLRRAD